MSVKTMTSAIAVATMLGLGLGGPALSAGMKADEGQVEIRSESGMSTLAVDDVVGRTVVNESGEEIGEITNVYRARDDEATYARVDVGNFLESDDHEVLLPLSSLEVGSDDNIVMSQGGSREDLQKVPEWNDAAGSDYVEMGEATRSGSATGGGDTLIDSGANPDADRDAGNGASGESR